MRKLNPTAASLLGFLHHGVMTGWDLAQTVEGSIGYFWNVTRSQIYRELANLEASGLVVMGATGARDKRPFAITAAGRKVFTEWIRREPGPELIRFPLLLTLFFGEFLDPNAIGRFLADHRGAHQQRLRQYREFLQAVDPAQPFIAATIRFGIAYEDAVLGWFDSLPWMEAASATDAGARGGRKRRSSGATPARTAAKRPGKKQGRRRK